jgi:hypothetical protein
MFPGVDMGLHMVCDAHLFVLSNDEQQEMAPNFVSIAWLWEAFHGLGIQDVKSLILVGGLFPLDAGRRREGKKKEKKKIAVGKEGFALAGPTLLAVLRSQLLDAIKG